MKLAPRGRPRCQVPGGSIGAVYIARGASRSARLLCWAGCIARWDRCASFSARWIMSGLLYCQVSKLYCQVTMLGRLYLQVGQMGKL